MGGPTRKEDALRGKRPRVSTPNTMVNEAKSSHYGFSRFSPPERALDHAWPLQGYPDAVFGAVTPFAVNFWR